jgi:hypothetical protein
VGTSSDVHRFDGNCSASYGSSSHEQVAPLVIWSFRNGALNASRAYFLEIEIP